MPEIKFPSDWIKINDNVAAGDIIQFLDAGTLDDQGKHVFVVAVFRDGQPIELEKKFGLNKTNFKAISEVYGTNSDNWIHKEMVINSIKVRNPQTGLLVDSIALSVPTAKPAPVAPAPAPAPEAPAAPAPAPEQPAA